MRLLTGDASRAAKSYLYDQKGQLERRMRVSWQRLTLPSKTRQDEPQPPSSNQARTIGGRCSRSSQPQSKPRKIWAEIEHRLASRRQGFEPKQPIAVNEAYELLKQLHSLGVSHPNAQQFIVYGGFVSASYQMRTPFAREGRFLAPNERRDWQALVDAWGKVVRNQLADRIGEQTNEKAA